MIYIKFFIDSFLDTKMGSNELQLFPSHFEGEKKKTWGIYAQYVLCKMFSLNAFLVSRLYKYLS